MLEDADTDIGVVIVIVPDDRREEIERRGGETGQGDNAALMGGHFFNTQDRAFIKIY